MNQLYLIPEIYMTMKLDIGLLYQEIIILYLYLIVLLIGFIPSEIYKIYKNFRIITNIYRIQHITSNLCGLFAVLFVLFKVNNKNKFIEFLILFNKNNFLKNELV